MRLFLIMAIVLSGCWAGVAHASDFRNASWGMSLSEVESLHGEQLPADRRLGRIAYDGRLTGLKVLIYYRFNEAGGLTEAGYEIETRDLAPATVLEQYQSLNTLLRRRYPESAAPQSTWRNDIFKAKPEQWGRAVRVGHLSYEWEHVHDSTRIQHALSGNRRSINHVIQYQQVAVASQEDLLEQL